MIDYATVLSENGKICYGCFSSETNLHVLLKHAARHISRELNDSFECATRDDVTGCYFTSTEHCHHKEKIDLLTQK